MYTLIAQNKYGQQIELTHNEAYVIESIEGIDPPEAVINVVKNANADGSVFNSAYVNERQIIITLAINGPAEDNRINLYRYFKNKYPIRLFYKNGIRDVYIDGFCKNMQVSFFNQKQIAQMTMVFPDPFFKSVNNDMIDFSNVVKDFEFPFEIVTPIPFSEIHAGEEKDIYNMGDVETGMEFYLTAIGSISNPTIWNIQTNEYYKLNISLSKGDEIYINTNSKYKKVSKITSAGVVSNIIGNLVNGSTWLQVEPGSNIFTLTADSNPQNLEAYCAISNRYEGV